MGFRFRKRIKLAPGLYVNLGKKGASVTAGVRGAHVTFGKTGTTTTVGLPGSGLSYSQHTPAARMQRATPAAPTAPPETPETPSDPLVTVIGWFLAAVIVGLVLLVAMHQ